MGAEVIAHFPIAADSLLDSETMLAARGGDESEDAGRLLQRGPGHRPGRPDGAPEHPQPGAERRAAARRGRRRAAPLLRPGDQRSNLVRRAALSLKPPPPLSAWPGATDTARLPSESRWRCTGQTFPLGERRPTSIEWADDPTERLAASSSRCLATAARSAGITSVSRNGLTRYANAPASSARSISFRSECAVSITIGIGRSA